MNKVAHHKTLCGFLARLAIGTSFMLLVTAIVPSRVMGATTLAAYDASTGLPSNTVWAGAANPNFSSYVTASIYDDEGRSALRIYDPGLARNESVTPNIAANRSYNYTLSSADHLLSVTQGWSLSATLKLPSNELNFVGQASSSGSWAVESQHWLGFYSDELIWNHASSKYERGADRYLYALMFGRNAQGETVVRPYNLGNSFDKVLTGDYHHYEIRFEPSWSTAKIFVDGEFWIDYTGHKADAIATTDTRYIYWGDNSSQPGSTASRATYWESVSISIVPEPKPTLLFALALSFLLMRRVRLSRS